CGFPRARSMPGKPEWFRECGARVDGTSTCHYDTDGARRVTSVQRAGSFDRMRSIIGVHSEATSPAYLLDRRSWYADSSPAEFTIACQAAFVAHSSAPAMTVLS